MKASSSRKGISPPFSFFLLVAFISLVAISPLNFRAQAQTQPNAESIPLIVSSGTYVRIVAPYSSNFTVLSVTGEEYDLNVFSVADEINELQFTPVNVSTYALEINVSGVGPNYAYVSKEGNPLTIPVKNVTGQGNLILNLTIQATPQPVQQGSWDPLFGVTGLRIPGFTLTFPVIVAILTAIGGLFLFLGIKFHSHVIYLGMMSLTISSIMVLGILVSLALVLAYVLSFVAINLIWSFDKRTRKS